MFPLGYTFCWTTQKSFTPGDQEIGLYESDQYKHILKTQKIY
jgi:hypothetical protein